MQEIMELNELIKNHCRTNKIRLIDAYPEFADGAGRLKKEYSYGDGGHLNGAGYKRLGELIAIRVADLLAHENTIACLGDSITEGYPYSILPLRGAEVFRPYPDHLRVEGVTVVNLGVAGDTALDMLERAREIVPASMDACIVMGGVNDLLIGRRVGSVLGTLADIYSTLEQADIAPFAMTVLPVRLLGLPFGQATASDLFEATRLRGPVR